MKKYLFILLLVSLFVFGCKPEILPLPHSVPAPEYFSVSSSSSGSGVDISWNRYSSSFGYVLYRASINGDFSIVSSGSSDHNSYTDESVNANTIYRYKLAHTNDSGFEGASCPEVVYIPPVSGVNAVTNGTAVELSWNAVAGAVSYSIYSTTSETSIYNFSLQAEVNTNSYTISYPSSSALYYSVKANYKDKAGDYSQRVNGQHGILPAPVISIYSNTYKENTLQWTRVDDAASYVLYRVAAGSSYTYSKTGITDTRYSWNDLGNVESYSYSVASVSASGTVGPKSESVIVTLADVPEISGVNYALNTEGSSCEISWTALSDTELNPVVKVTYDTNSSETYGENTKYYSLAQNATSYTVPFSYKDAEYTVSVHAAYNGLRSAGSTPETYYSLPKPALSTYLDAGGIRITWSSNYQFWKDSGTVTLFRSNDVDSDIKEIPVFDPRSGEIIDTNTEPAVTYTYYIRHSLGGYSMDTSDATYSYDGLISWGRFSYSGIKVDFIDIELDWDDYAIADEYHVYRSTAEEGPYTYLVQTTVSEYFDKNLSLGTKYYYKIKTKIGSFLSDFSPVKSATIWGAKPESPSVWWSSGYSRFSFDDYTTSASNTYARIECRLDADKDGSMDGANDETFFLTNDEGSEHIQYESYYFYYYTGEKKGNFSFRVYSYRTEGGTTYEALEPSDWTSWRTVD